MEDLYIIAECGINHNGDLVSAYKMINAAIAAGANCIKFQAFSADELSTKYTPKVKYQKEGAEDNETQYKMLKRYEMVESDFVDIKDYCSKSGIDFLATPFSTKWVKKLFSMGVNCFKVSSGSINQKMLLLEIGKTELPIILSTGMSITKEIKDAINILKSNNCGEIHLLHCVSVYPAKIEQINLYSIPFLIKEFGFRVGFSDHTTEIESGGLAVAAGATILEKHFTLDKKAIGPDHKVSLSPNELKLYIENAKRVLKICGRKTKNPGTEELIIKKYVQTNLVFTKKIKKGDIITEDILVEKRAYGGISSMEIDKVIGKIALKDFKIDEILKYKYLGQKS